MNSNNKFEDLIEFMLSEAEKFLEELGEFFQFASVLNSKKELSSIGIYDDHEDFDALKAIRLFEQGIKKKFDNDEILLAAIDINGYIRSNNKDVILIKVTNDGVTWYERNFSNEIENGKVKIEKYIN